MVTYENKPEPIKKLDHLCIDSLKKLITYLKTWQNDNGLFGGMIATWWSSTFETAVPHPMNQFPVIQGYISLYKAWRRSELIEEAIRIGDGLLRSIRQDGMIENCWGDIPGKGTGTVIFAGPALALAELACITGYKRYLIGSNILLQTIETRWSLNGINKDGVANQGLKWAEALIAYSKASSEVKLLQHAKKLGYEALRQQIQKGLERGGIHQSRTDDRLITVYQGKCLAPLIRLFEETNEEYFLYAASILAQYINKQIINEGIFLNYRSPEGLLYKTIRTIPRKTDWRLFRRRIPTYRIWRDIKTQWMTIDYPSFIARSADSIRGFWLLAKHLPEYRHVAEQLTLKLISYQLCNGGFPNTIGFCGSKRIKLWQDVCAPTRWNAYVFLLLCTILSESCTDTNIFQSEFDEKYYCENVGLSGDTIYTETSSNVTLSISGRIIANILKPSGISIYIDDAWRGDLSGDRNRKNLCLN